MATKGFLDRLRWDAPTSGESKPARGSRRIEVLDAFRGLAVIAVILFHYTFRWGPDYAPGAPDLYHYPARIDWFSQGWMGVYLFFIISGFVIFMTLERCKTIFEFALRRIARLYPAYLICMTATFLVTTILGVPEFVSSFKTYLVGFSLASSHINFGWVDAAYWSLLVEIKFYVWVSILFYLFKSNFTAAWIAFLAICCVGEFQFTTLAHGLLSPTNMPFFTFGIAFYFIHRDKAVTLKPLALFVAGGAMYLLLWHERPAVIHLLTALTLLLFGLFVAGRLQWLRQRWLLYIGAISYPLYLLHQAIGVALISRMAPATVPAQIATLLGVTALITIGAALVHTCVELPIYRLVHRGFSRAPQPQAPSTQTPAQPR